MSLFTGDVVDQNGVAIDCSFRFLHYETGALSNVRATELQQWQVDSDDSDVNNQAAAFAVGDTAIIHFYTDTVCGIVKVISDGSNSYVFNVQLIECVAPTVTLHSVSGVIVREAYTASSSSSDEYQWDYEGVTHYHKNSWYGQTWCTEVGIQTVEYDFGAGFSTVDSHTYDTSGIYTVAVKVTNICGLTAEDSIAIDVKYAEPSVSLSNLPIVPAVGETTTVTPTIIDPDNRSTGVVYKLDGVVITNLALVFDSIGVYTVTAELSWNDGFIDKIINASLVIHMSAANIQLTLSNKLVNDEYVFTSEVVKGDGDYTGITYEVSYTLPISGQIVEVYETVGSEIQIIDLLLPGVYAVRATVVDEYGMTANDSNLVTVECENCDTWCLTQDTIDYVMSKTYLPDTDEYNIEDHIKTMYMVVKGECTKVTMTDLGESLIIKDKIDIINIIDKIDIITIIDKVDKIVVTDISDPL